MTPQELLAAISPHLNILASKEDLGVLHITVVPADALKAAEVLKEKSSLDLLNFMSAIDRPAEGQIEVIYKYTGTSVPHSCVVRVSVERENGKVPTICFLHRGAEWHERETWEMFGVRFEGHPDLRPLLLPDGVKAPLRKDFRDGGFEPLPQA